MPYNTTIRLQQRAVTPTENGALRDAPAVEERGVTYAAWLSEDIMLLAGALGLNEHALPSTVVSYGHPSHAEATAAPEALWFTGTTGCDLLLLSGLNDPATEIRIEHTHGKAGGEEATLPFERTDLRTLVREKLAGLPTTDRLGILSWITTGLLGSRAHDKRFTRSLRLIREALRERLPVCKVSKDERQGMHIGSLLAIDQHALYTRGWMWDAETDIVRLTVESPEGMRTELLDQLVWHPRADILKMYGATASEEPEEQPGFISYFQTPLSNRGAQGWIFEMRNSEGEALQVDGPALIRDLPQVRRKIIADLNAQHQHSPGLLEQHSFPALQRIQEQYLDTVNIEQVYQYGPPPAAPAVSMMIPLYNRIDLIEHQLAQFAHDAQCFQTDLIYVLDSPHLADQLATLAPQLYYLYRIPFRVALLNHNGGIALAHNLAASLARGTKLLLFDSDVFPDTPGWLETMTAFYDATPKIGALGPKLLFEDDALQHAGIHFTKRLEDEQWEERFYFKGFHRRFPGANTTRTVPAVTRACFMIDRALYEQLGGLHPYYIKGGHEDLDLCLRLQEAGYENWYLPEAELYHLESQSYPPDAQERVAFYNHWLHSQRWNAFLDAQHNATAP